MNGCQNELSPTSGSFTTNYAAVAEEKDGELWPQPSKALVVRTISKAMKAYNTGQTGKAPGLGP